MITTKNALPGKNRKKLAVELGRLTYSAEGFGASRVAPRLTWTLLQELPDHNVVQATGAPNSPFYYVQVTTLAQVLARSAKLRLATNVSRALECEGSPLTPEHLEQVWVHFREWAAIVSS